MTVNASEIMKIGKNLLEQYPEAFTEDFETNKRKVSQLTDIRTHHTQNRIAGHITRTVQSERSEGEYADD
jgi:small subunit ribosomal protein S17e